MKNPLLREFIKTDHRPTARQRRQKNSKLTLSQKQQYTTYFQDKWDNYRITVQLRYDDECRNGHNTFAITATIDRQSKNGRWVDSSGGCLHEEISKRFPRLKPFIKWHLISSDAPLHYIANALYWAGHTQYKDVKNEAHFKSTIIYGALESDFAIDFMNLPSDKLKEALTARLPLLMKEFRKAVEALGFIW